MFGVKMRVEHDEDQRQRRLEVAEASAVPRGFVHDEAKVAAATSTISSSSPHLSPPPRPTTRFPQTCRRPTTGRRPTMPSS